MAAWPRSLVPDFDNEGLLTAFFRSLPGQSFLINSAKPERDGAQVSAGFEYKLSDGWSVLGKFDGAFSSTTAIFAGTGTLRRGCAARSSRSIRNSGASKTTSAPGKFDVGLRAHLARLRTFNQLRRARGRSHGHRP